jgi:hypothetical protein
MIRNMLSSRGAQDAGMIVKSMALSPLRPLHHAGTIFFRQAI